MPELPTPGEVTLVTVGLLAALLLGAVVMRLVGRRRFVDPVDRATYETLHTASLATRSLRDGLTPEGATRATRHLRSMLGSTAVAIVDTARCV